LFTVVVCRLRQMIPSVVVVVAVVFAGLTAAGCAHSVATARPVPPAGGARFGAREAEGAGSSATSLFRPRPEQLPFVPEYVFPSESVSGFVLQSIGFRESLSRWLTMDMTFVEPGTGKIYEAQAFDAGHAVDVLERCGLVATNRGQICAPYDGDSGRTTYRWDGDVLVRVRSIWLTDRDLVRVRDSVRVVTRESISDVLSASNSTSWQFQGAS